MKDEQLAAMHRLLADYAVGDAVRRPLVGGDTGHISDGESRVYPSRLLGDFPAVHSALRVYVRYQYAIRGLTALSQRYGLFARRCQSRFVANFAESFVDDCLYFYVIFND